MSITEVAAVRVRVSDKAFVEDLKTYLEAVNVPSAWWARSLSTFP